MKFLVHGRPQQAGVEGVFGESGDEFAVEVLNSYDLSVTRGEGVTPIEIEVDDQAVAELTAETGEVLYLRADELEEDLRVWRGLQRDDSHLTIDSSYWRSSDDTRSMKKLVLRGLRFFGIKSKDDALAAAAKGAAHLTAKAVAAKIESKLVFPNQISRLGSFPDAKLEGISAGDIPVGRPVLLFIHGTASTTEGSFGGLWQASHGVMSDLAKAYPGAIFAFEHATLTKSPLENALDLVSQLPKGARLHLVSHSRGGQVGELLCRANRTEDAAPFDEHDLAFFDPASDLHELALDEDFLKSQRDHLKALNNALEDKVLVVEKFVRVACPVGGTSILSKRLDRWFNLVLNAAGAAGLGAHPVYQFIKTFLVALVAERRDAQDFPGLESMTPESAVARLITRRDVRVASDLTVIAGDVGVEGIRSFLTVLATDWLYGGDHDLVVNTISMRGGAGRLPAASREYFESRADVNHFSYFKSESSASKIRNALLLNSDQLSGFKSLKPFVPGSVRGRTPEPVITGDRPAVFVLPGIMGSNLAVDGDRVWIDFSDLIAGGMAKLAIGKPNIEPDGPHEDSYSDLIAHLSQSHDVVVFPYDWRLSIEDEAKRLSVLVDQRLTSVPDQPVRFLAHSMGGLVVRSLQAQNRNDVWDRVTARSEWRLIMLGTPNGGSHSIVRTLIGWKGLIKLLAGLDFSLSKTELLEIIARYPGLLQLLPDADAAGNQYFRPEVWDRLDDISRLTWFKPVEAEIAAAGAFRQSLNGLSVDPRHVIYVAGKAKETPVSMQFRDPDGFRPLRFFGTEAGDGSVPWASGILHGSSVWYTQAEHGALPRHREAFAAYEALLDSGDTTSTAVSRNPPASKRRGGELFELDESTLLTAPSEAALEDVVFDIRPRDEARKAPASELSVTFVHGDLCFAASPVIVGHYRDDAILSAESIIDSQLDNRLSNSMSTGQYPERIGEADVFLGGEEFPGAIVIGLGTFGSLTAASLARAHQTGVLDYVRTLANQTCRDPELELSVTSLLIGSGEGGLSVADSVAALIQGIQQANQHLSAQSPAIRISHVDIVEIWEDRTLEALYAARDLAHGLTGVTFDTEVAVAKGARRRLSFRPDLAWWRQIHVRLDEERRMVFNALTDRARIDTQHMYGRFEAIEAYIASASQFSHAHGDAVGRTLFEYLVPHAYKPFGLDAENIRLGVDEHTANIPWELIRDRASEKVDDAKPLSVKSGMIRQLLVDRPEALRETARGGKVLVIADPANTGMAPLNGAEAEGREVSGLLNSPWDVTLLSRPTHSEILESVVAEDYQVMHIAGHGVVERDDDGKFVQAGLVAEDGKLITGTVISSMRRVPELVFINCCHLAQQQTGTAKVDDFRFVASSLARETIGMGAKAVVAAGWAVSDDLALDFAKTFYNRMLKGATFGSAVKDARSAIYQTGNNTWGAYQCYGNPDYRLINEREEKKASRRSYLSPREAVLDLENLLSDAASADAAEEVRKVKKNLSLCVSGLKSDWLQNGNLLTTIGRIYGELEEFEKGIDYLTRALAADTAPPTNVVEELANYEARLGLKVFNDSRTRAREFLRSSKKRLDLLMDLAGTSSRRYSLLGGTLKRYSQVDERRRRLGRLIAAAKAYETAARLAGRQSPASTVYPETQALLCRIAWLRSQTKVRDYASDEKNALDTIERLKSSVEAFGSTPRDPWSLAAPIDLKLTKSLWQGELPQHENELMESYRKVLSRSSSRKERGSIRDTLDFLIFHYGLDDARNAAEHRSLKTLRSALGGEVEGASVALGGTNG